MQNYFDRYVKRVSNNSLDSKEGIKRFVRSEYENWIKQSPTRQIVEIDGEEVECSIQSNRFRDEENLKYLVTRWDNEFPLGSLVYYTNDSGQPEIWMLLRHEPHPFGGDNRYVMIQCKHIVQWVDTYGVLQQSPCLMIGAMDSKIKENFRTWNSMITPQPNKVLEVIMPYQYIARGTRILIEDEAWYLVDYDKATIKGVAYMSFTETAVNLADDDRENNIADSNKLGMYTINFETDPFRVMTNVVTQLKGEVKRNGVIVNEEIAYICEDPNVEINGDLFLATVGGTYIVRAHLKSNPGVISDLNVISANVPANSNYFIKGDDRVRWGRSASYTFMRYNNGHEEIADTGVVSLVDPDGLATLRKENDTYILTGNSDNRTGEVMLHATIGFNTATKIVRIISLWG